MFKKKTRATVNLGAFIATPDSLIDPLIGFAGLNVQSLFLDLGSGDGKVVMDIADKTGCKAIGIENNPELVKRALTSLEPRGLSEKVEFICDDAMDYKPDQIVTAHMFVPVRSLRSMVPTLMSNLHPGSQIIAHEQRAPKKLPKPDNSELLLSDTALTVAHRWQV